MADNRHKEQDGRRAIDSLTRRMNEQDRLNGKSLPNSGRNEQKAREIATKVDNERREKGR